MALLDDAANPNLRKVRLMYHILKNKNQSIYIIKRSHIVETEPFKETFGPKAQRKRPRIEVGTFEELGQLGATAADKAENDNVEDGTTGMYLPSCNSNLGADHFFRIVNRRTQCCCSGR